MRYLLLRDDSRRPGEVILPLSSPVLDGAQVTLDDPRHVHYRVTSDCCNTPIQNCPGKISILFTFYPFLRVTGVRNSLLGFDS